MKYFSPQLLDGSVTEVKLADLAVATAKLAVGAVTRSRVATSTGSQAGTIASQGRVGVVLNAWSFFPDIEADKDSNITRNTVMLADFKVVPSASDAVPEFELFNEDTVDSRDYSVAWRYIIG